MSEADRDTVRADLVAAMLPIRDDGKFLVLQRPEGTWDPPGGRLAAGETFEEGAVRELYEESGLLVAPERMISTWLGGSAKGRLAAVTYLGRVAGGDVEISDEHTGYLWVSPDEWLDLESWWSPENRRHAGEMSRLLDTGKPPAVPPTPRPRRDAPPVEANLGAGSVVVDLHPEEPRALLMRRLKPPVGLWENPGGMLESGEDFVACARRETFEETGIDIEPESPWWARIDPWRHPEDTELYAGMGFISRYTGGEVRLEDAAHDEYRWVTEEEWRSLDTWYTAQESDALWAEVNRLRGKSDS